MSEERVWYSICSMHHEFSKECAMCRAGHWHTPAELEASRELWERDRDAWLEQANTPEAKRAAFTFEERT